MRETLRIEGATVLAWNNHPVGGAVPSREGIVLTRSLRAAVDLVDVSLNDHIIVGWESFYSFWVGGGRGLRFGGYHSSGDHNRGLQGIHLRITLLGMAWESDPSRG